MWQWPDEQREQIKHWEKLIWGSETQFILQDCKSPFTVFPAARGCLLWAQPCKIHLPVEHASLACHEWQDKVTKSILLGLLCLFQAYSAISLGISANAASLGKIKQLLFLWLLVWGFSSICLFPSKWMLSLHERWGSDNERGNVLRR